MISRPGTIRTVLLIVGLLMLAVFVGAGYGMILVPIAVIGFALALGAAGAMFGSR